MPESQSNPASRTHAHPALRFMLVLTPVLFAVLTWTIIGSLFVIQQRGGGPGDLLVMLGLAVVTFTFSIGSYAVAVLVDTHPNDHWLLLGLLVVAAAFSGFEAVTLLVFALLAIGFGSYRRAIRRELAERIRFSAPKVLRAGLGLTLTLVLLAVSIQSLAAAAPFAGPEALLEDALGGAAAAVERVAPTLLPGFERNKPIDTYYAEQRTATGASVAIARNQLADYLRISLTGRETMSEVIQLAIERRVKPSIVEYAGVVFPLLIVSLFLLLKLLSPILIAGILGVALLLFHLYERFKIIHLRRETIEVERLEVI